MNKEPKISVIVPVYNKEKYLKKCLDSIVNQTYQNLEVIIVNDGSKDDSKAVCENYLSDTRVQLINTENRGAPSARNTGLDLATGDYISFVDADDYIVKDFYKIMYQMIEDNQADMAQCRCKRISMEEELESSPKYDVKVLSNIDLLFDLYGKTVDDWINTVIISNKLFSRKLFQNGIRWIVGRIIDDEFFTYKLIYNSKRIAVTDSFMYAYVQSENSIMRTNFKEKRVYDSIDAYEEVYRFFLEKKQKELVEKILIRYLEICIELLEKTIKSDSIEEKAKIYQYLKENFEEKYKILNETYLEGNYHNLYTNFYQILK